MSRRQCSVLASLMAAQLCAQAPARVAAQAQPEAPAAPALTAPAGNTSAGLSPTWFWFGASATIITASLGGFYALRVRDLYDESHATPGVSPKQLELRDQMIAAEHTADLLFLGALALATGTIVLAFHVDWSGSERARPSARSDQQRWTLTPVLLPSAASVQLRGALP